MAAMFQTRHYSAIAVAVAATPLGMLDKNEVINKLCTVFAADNHNFNSFTFKREAGYIFGNTSNGIRN